MGITLITPWTTWTLLVYLACVQVVYTQDVCDNIPLPCENGTKYASHEDCTKYYRCSDEGTQLREKYCSDGKLFNAETLKCRSAGQEVCAPTCAELKANNPSLLRSAVPNAADGSGVNTVGNNETAPEETNTELEGPDAELDTPDAELESPGDATTTGDADTEAVASGEVPVIDTGEDTDGNATVFVLPGMDTPPPLPLIPGDDEEDTLPTNGTDDLLPVATDSGVIVPIEASTTTESNVAVVPVETDIPVPEAEITTPQKGPSTISAASTAIALDPNVPVVVTEDETTSGGGNPPYVVVTEDNTSANGTVIDAPRVASGGLSQKTILIIAGAAGGVVLIVLIILIVVCVRRKKRSHKEKIEIIENPQYRQKLENPIYRKGRDSPSQAPVYRFSQDADVVIKPRPNLPKRTRKEFSPGKSAAPGPPKPFMGGGPTPPGSRSHRAQAPRRPPPPVLGVQGSTTPEESPAGQKRAAPPPPNPFTGKVELPERPQYRPNLRDNNNTRNSPIYSKPKDDISSSNEGSLQKRRAPAPPNPFGEYYEMDSEDEAENVPMNMLSTFGKPVANNLSRPDDVYHVDQSNPVIQKPSPHAPLLERQSSHEMDDAFEDGEGDGVGPERGPQERNRSTDYSDSSSEESSSEEEDTAAAPFRSNTMYIDDNPYDVPNGVPASNGGVSTFTNRIYDKPKA